ncbi:hypothetical protein BU17DRAFT_91377 [Hysterangium stoloniferum]|nr:hypothetical protein BU17DRAFT_91377 [Hysterangium stoloniferum]
MPLMQKARVRCYLSRWYAITLSAYDKVSETAFQIGILPPRKLNRSNNNNSASRSSSSTVPVDRPLAARVRELEHALATLQATYVTTPHPLLANESRTPADRDDEARLPPTESAVKDDVEILSENLGTLSMTGYGKSRFIGSVGSAIHLWTEMAHNDCDGSVDEDLNFLGLPPEIIYVSAAFLPMRTATSGYVADWMISNLPPSPEAWSLCETFFENGGYMQPTVRFVPVWRTMFIEEIFAAFYSAKTEQIVDIPRGHRLALLLMQVFFAWIID